MTNFFDFLNDVAFKKVFNHHERLTRKFLNATLRLEGERSIQTVEFLPQELLPKTSESKKSILDVKCTDQRGFQYIVEVQNKPMQPYLQRVQYYVAHTYSGQLKKAKSYLELKPVTMLSILGHTLFPEDIPCLSFHSMREAETQRSYLKDMSYAFIELPKFTKSWEELNTLEDYWIYILKEATHMQAIPKEAPEEIKDALHLLEEHSWNEAERDAYLKAKMLVMDEESLISTARNEGLAEGEAKGREEGREEGVNQRNLEIARNLLSKGIDPDTVSEATGLTKQKIEELF